MRTSQGTQPEGGQQPATLDASDDRALEPGRGREAARPSALPLAGWKDVGYRVYREFFEDQIPIVAGSVAFFGMLALFPLLIAMISLYGLLADPGDVVRSLPEFTVAMPPITRRLIGEQLLEIARGSSTTLGLGLFTSLLFTLVSAAGGAEALISGINIAYDQPETRSMFKLRLLALKFTLLFIVGLCVSLALIAVVPPLIERLGMGEQARWLAALLRWPALAIAMIGGLSVMYRQAPNRTPARWPWVTWGATLATALWLLASWGLSAYIANFGSFNRTYGTLGGVMGLLLWFYLSAIAVLIGAEVNAELERQTAVDSTVGPDRPLGERGAFVADTLGAARPSKSS